MIVCQSLAEAAKVPNVVMIEASNPPIAYQKGDVLPAYVVVDQAALAVDATRTTAIDTSIKGGTLGAVQPATVDQLKAMTVAEYSAWFDANFTTAATLIALLKRLTLIVIRRVL